MNVRRFALATFLAISVLLPGSAFCDKWTEFHTEKWDFKSEKLNRNLQFRNSYFYDADSMLRSKNGDVTAWVKELAENDRYYVSKGVPVQETIFRKILIRCSLNRYEILLEDEVEAEKSESMSEDIKAGTYYERLQAALCKPKK